MPSRCGCSGSCSCLIVAGEGVSVEGIGTIENPYEISSEGSELLERVEFVDTSTVDFTTVGVGTTLDPMTVTAQATLEFTDLTDVEGTPGDGQVPVWTDDHWEFSTPVSQVAVSGEWGTAPLTEATYGANSLTGRVIYEDSAGQLRSAPEQLTQAGGQYPVTASPTVYPSGTTVMYIAPAEGAAWPTGASCIVTTSKAINGAAQQWCAEPNNTGARSWFRNGQSAGWSPWKELGSGGGGGGSAVVEPVYSSSRVHTAATSIPSSVHTPIPFNTEMWTDGIPFTTDSFTVPVTGYYQVDATGTIATNATGVRSLSIVQNTSYVDTVQYSTDELEARPAWASRPRSRPSPGTPSRSGSTRTAVEPWRWPVGRTTTTWPSRRCPRWLPAVAGWWWSRSPPLTEATRAPWRAPPGRRCRSRGTPRSTTAGTSRTRRELRPIPVAGCTTSPPRSAGRPGVDPATGCSSCSSTGPRRSPATPGTTVTNPYTTVTQSLLLAAGDTVKFDAQQSSGVSLNVYGGTGSNHVSITKVPQAFSGSAVSTYGERNYSTTRGHAAATSIPNATSTIVPFDTASIDDGIPFDGSGFVVPVDGFYDVEAVLTYAASNTTGARYLLIATNGSSQFSSAASPAAAAAVSSTLAGTLKLTAGQRIEIRAYQTSGVAVALSGNAAYNRVSVTKVPAPVINGAAASGVWGVGPLAGFGSNDLLGREIYIDSNGQLRSKPVVDSNWVPLTGIAGGWTVPSPYLTPQARLYGHEVIFRGRLVNATFTGGYTDLAVLPASSIIPYPAYASSFPAATNTPAYRALQVLTTGMVQVYSIGGQRGPHRLRQPSLFHRLRRDMAYADIAALQQDSDFAYRVMACYAVETLEVDGGPDPASWQAVHAWDMAAQPGFGDAYAYAIETHPDDPDYRPGKDPAVITDEQILAAVQSLLPQPPDLPDGGLPESEPEA